MGVQRPGRRGDDCIAGMVLANLQKISRGCHATRGLAPVLGLAQPGLILLLRGLPPLHSHGSKKAIEQEIAAKRDLIPASNFATHEKPGAAFRSARRRKYPSLASLPPRRFFHFVVQSTKHQYKEHHHYV